MPVKALAAGMFAATVALASPGIGKEYFPDGLDVDPMNWPAFGRTFGSQGFSPLAEINTGDISKLGLAWSYDLERQSQMTAPVEADGTLYIATGWSVVTALDAATGKELWRYDPDVAQRAGGRLHMAWGTRALSWDDGRVFVGTQDGRLIALDAKSGQLDWSVQTTEPNDSRYITGAPRPFNGKVVIGHGGGDFNPTRGYVTCYDARTGKQLWRFYTVPDPQGSNGKAEIMAAKTWFGDGWKKGGGGAVWNSISYDPEFNRVYIGTGNPQPYNRNERSNGQGDNLFTDSIVALDADTGEYVWHYQVNPGDEWDFDASSDMLPATLKVDGKPRKVLLQAPKNGFFYVIDRADGKLISAQPFAKVSWATKIDLATGRPVEVEASRFHGKKPFLMWPSEMGAHNWLPMSFNPKTGLVYIPVTDHPVLWQDPVPDYMPEVAGEGGYLKAWDPVKQKPAWVGKNEGPCASGGIMSTGGGLVFQGQCKGAFNAYDASTGKVLWSFDTHSPVLAPPITYTVGQQQYVTVVSGFGGQSPLMQRFKSGEARWDYYTMPRQILTFAIGATMSLPPAPPPAQRPPAADPSFVPDSAQASKSAADFGGCVMCHGFDAVANGTAPDLRFSPLITSAEAFQSVVHGGALQPQGMPKFDQLTPEQIEGIRFYLRTRAHDTGATPAKAINADVVP